MKFQDSSFNGLKVTVGTKSVTHPRTHARTLQKQYAPSTFFKVGGIKRVGQTAVSDNQSSSVTLKNMLTGYILHFS